MELTRWQKIKRWLTPWLEHSAESLQKLTQAQLLLVDLSQFLYNVLVWWFIGSAATLLICNHFDQQVPLVVVAIAVGMLGGFIALYRKFLGFRNPN